jgi:hypothetical protein
MNGHLIILKTIAVLESLEEQFLDSAKKRQGALFPALDQRFASSKQVSQTLLMDCCGELVEDRPVVMSKDSRLVRSQQTFGRFHAAGRVNLIISCGQSNKCMQPSRSPIYAAARFVRHHLGRTTNGNGNGSRAQSKRRAVRGMLRQLVLRPSLTSNSMARRRFTLP